MADSLIAIGQKDQVIPLLKKELKKYPKNEDLLRSLGFACIEENKLDEGEKFYRQALSVNPKCARCELHIGRVAWMKNNTAQALEHFNAAVKLDPADASVLMARAQLHETLGDKSSALNDFNEAVKTNPENAGVYHQRAMFNFRDQLLPLAISDLKKAIELDPSNAELYYDRSNVYYTKKQFKEALNDLNTAIEKNPDRQMYYTARGAVFSAMGETKKAMEDYTKSIALNPDDYLPYYNRALNYYSLEDMDAYCTDITMCHSLLSKTKADTALLNESAYLRAVYCDSATASYYYQRGIAKYNLGDYENAIDYYTLGIIKFPDNTLLLSFRGNALLAKRDFSKALADFEASMLNKENLKQEIKLNNRRFTDESGERYTRGFLGANYLSMAQCKFALKRYSEALEDINKAIPLIPDIKDIGPELFYNTRGNILIALGRNAEAIQDFNMCIQMEPQFAPPYLNKVFAQLNKTGRLKLRSDFIGERAANFLFLPDWTIPTDASAKKAIAELSETLEDCDKAILLAPDWSTAYYIRGRIKALTGLGDFCSDLLNAQKLGYFVEASFLKFCK